MAKDDTIEVEGKVLEIIPGGKFKVQLENGYIVEAHVSGKLGVKVWIYKGEILNKKNRATKGGNNHVDA